MLWQFIIMVLIVGADYIPPTIPPAPNSDWFFKNSTYRQFDDSNWNVDKGMIKPTIGILHWDGSGHKKPLLPNNTWTADNTYNYLKNNGYSSHVIFGLDKTIQGLPVKNGTIASSKGSSGRNDIAMNFEIAGSDFDKRLRNPAERKIIMPMFERVAAAIADAYFDIGLPLENWYTHGEQDTIKVPNPPSNLSAMEYKNQFALNLKKEQNMGATRCEIPNFNEPGFTCAETVKEEFPEAKKLLISMAREIVESRTKDKAIPRMSSKFLK